MGVFQIGVSTQMALILAACIVTGFALSMPVIRVYRAFA